MTDQFRDDPFQVMNNPFSNQYERCWQTKTFAETGNPPVIRVKIFDDSRDELVSELLKHDPSSTAIGDIKFYDDFKEEIDKQIEAILEEYESETNHNALARTE